MLNQPIDDAFVQLITSGGDTRLLLGPTGLNRYGSGPRAGSKTQFGSCTSSSPSPRALAAAQRLHSELKQHPSPALLAGEHFGIIRNQLRKFLALPTDTDIAITPSGTDVEMLALALAASKTEQPIVNVVVGPAEVGTGTSDASAIRYFDSLTPRGEASTAQQPVDIDLAARVSIARVGVRNALGQQLSIDEIDREVVKTVIDAAATGAHVVVHLVAHSKTGWHSASSDWTNVGLLLRWTAAIAEMEAFYKTNSDVREVVFSIFAKEVANTIAASRSCSMFPTSSTDTANNLPNISSRCSVFAFEVKGPNAPPLSKAQLKELHQQLNIDRRYRFLIGQPVQLGANRCVLRVALGAPMIVDVATNRTLGKTLDHRLSLLRENIRSCFRAIDSLVLTNSQIADSNLVKIAQL